MGATPEKLAWSIATGVALGINPILGTSTTLCFLAAFVFRLNVAASQLGNYAVYPLQILLLIPFLRLGSRIFGSQPIPLSPAQLLVAARTSPLQLTRTLWLWEWHALIVWSVLAAIATPILALILKHVLSKLLKRIEHHQYPIIPESSTPENQS